MLLLKWILVILHIITAAAWFGLGLRLTGQARTVVERDGDARLAVAEEGQRSVWLMTIFILLTVVFSISAFIAGGHFAAYGPEYHTALLLIVVLAGVHWFVIRSGWNDLHRLVQETAPDTENLESARKRVAIGTGVGHLIWLVLLVLMFTTRLVAAL